MQLHESREITIQCRSAVTRKMTETVKDKEGNTKEQAVNKSFPCARITAHNTCTTYRWPAALWHQRECPFAQRVIKAEVQKKVNPLKASRRAAKKADAKKKK